MVLRIIEPEIFRVRICRDPNVVLRLRRSSRGEDCGEAHRIFGEAGDAAVDGDHLAHDLETAALGRHVRDREPVLPGDAQQVRVPLEQQLHHTCETRQPPTSTSRYSFSNPTPTCTSTIFMFLPA